MRTKLFLSTIVLMSMMLLTPCSARTAIESHTSEMTCELSDASGLPKMNKADVKKLMPANIVVKQTTLFDDGRTLTIYYKKSGMQCEVYSPCNSKDYKVSDAPKIKSTTFEVVDHVEGKLYQKASLGEMAKVFKRLVNQYL